MMTKSFYFFLIVTVLFLSCTEEEESTFNLDFERYDPGMQISTGWDSFGDYAVTADSTITNSGVFSIKISSTENKDAFGCAMYSIPADYGGKTLKLEGYIKTENIDNGTAGLFLRIDGNGKTLAFGDSEHQIVKENISWTKFIIERPYPKKAEKIIVGGILRGRGTAWFDDLKVTIDGKDIQTLETKSPKVLKADTDSKFDAGSNIVFPEISNDLVKNLSLLGKVWGFLKYYHPAVAKGHYNWDYELFRILPDYIKITEEGNRSQFLVDWIDKLGKIEICDTCSKLNKEASLIPDYSWVKDREISKNLKKKLDFIYNNRHQGTGYYVGRGGANQATFENENAYDNSGVPDQGFRLIALYRYWNAIHYFFPYRDLTDNPWQDVLDKFIPQVINCKSELEYEKTIARLVAEINDTHGFLIEMGFNQLEALKGAYYAPFKVDFIEGKLVVTAYYEDELKEISKLKVGDIITHINSKTIETIVEEKRPLYAASNDAALLRDVSKDILRSPEKKIKITFRSNDVEEAFELPLYAKDDLDMKWYNYDGDKSYKVLNNNIGYITFETIAEVEIPKLKETLRNTRGIILDIRNYPFTPVFRTLGPYFISESTEYSKFSKPNLDLIGEFIFNEPTRIWSSEDTYKGKLIVLVNQETQSQAEHLAMMFRSGSNTTIIGSTTAGADGDITSITLPGGLSTYFTGLGTYYPDNTPTQRVGIIPDIVVKPTIEGIQSGKDELLNKAIEIILDQS